MKSRWKRHFLGMILLLSFGLMPSLSLGAQNPWKSLDNFTPLPGSLRRIGGPYVAMILVNRDEQVMAAVFFEATCFADRCELNHRAGYAMVDADGSNPRVYVEPQEEKLNELLRSISDRYSKRF